LSDRPAGSSNPARGFGPALGALALCGATQLLFGVEYVALRGDPGPAGYLLLVSGLTLALALVVAGVAGLLPRSVDAALAAWVAVESVTAFGSSPELGVPLGLALGVSTGLALWLGAPSAPSAGLIVGAALCGGFLVGPTAAEVASARASVGPPPQWLGAAVSFEIVLFPLALLSRWRRRVLAIPIQPAVALGGMAAVLLYVSFEHPQPDTSPFIEGPSDSTGSLPNIVVLILDTVRADHLSLYGYERKTTPELDRLVETNVRATVFQRAYANANWTIPSHISLFTGVLPSEHESHCGNEVHRRARVIDLPETLAERLGGAGYRTAGVIANPNVMAVESAGRGFRLWMLASAPRSLGFVGERLRKRFFPLAFRKQLLRVATARRVNRRLLELLDSCEDGGCFIVANYIDAHTPYLPNAPYAGRFGTSDPRTAPLDLQASDRGARVERAAAAYDEEILELDANLGRLFRELETRGMLDRMWLFITSDHGEAFQEHHSVHHASNVYNEEVRIPLVVVPPRDAFLPRREEAVSLLDVSATISAIATGEVLGHGRDLRDPGAAELGVQIEFFGCPTPEHSWGEFADVPARAVVRGDRKLIELLGRRELYFLDSDPRERSNRASAWPEVLESLSAELPPLESRSDRVREESATIDPAAAAALRQLGYLD
jgi:arylsulfatase A-like enzyme